MAFNYTSYECSCGGMITESWDHISLHVQCDNCEDPIPKEMESEIQNINTQSNERM